LVAFAGSQMYEQFIVSRAIRLKMGMDIQFRTKVLAETRMERFTATSYQYEREKKEKGKKKNCLNFLR